MAQFIQALMAAGLPAPQELHADGQLHRFSTNGKPRDEAGWYVLYADGVGAGAFGCWRSGISQVWCAQERNALTPCARDRLRQHLQQAKIQRDSAYVQRQQQAQAKAMKRWRVALTDPGMVNEHAYLRAKNVQGLGLRVERRAGSQSALLVPMRDTFGVLHSLQTIHGDGRKRFLGGGRMKACYCAIGKLGRVAVVAEGFATAASIHMATGLAVAAAFSACNLAHVAVALRNAYPNVHLLIAADDDRSTKGNPGLTAAHAAARLVNALVAVPVLPTQAESATDFNDMHRLSGLGVVRACFDQKLKELQ